MWYTDQNVHQVIQERSIDCSYGVPGDKPVLKVVMVPCINGKAPPTQTKNNIKIYMKSKYARESDIIREGFGSTTLTLEGLPAGKYQVSLWTQDHEGWIWLAERPTEILPHVEHDSAWQIPIKEKREAKKEANKEAKKEEDLKKFVKDIRDNKDGGYMLWQKGVKNTIASVYDNVTASVFGSLSKKEDKKDPEQSPSSKHSTHEFIRSKTSLTKGSRTAPVKGRTRSGTTDATRKWEDALSRRGSKDSTGHGDTLIIYNLKIRIDLTH